MADKPLALVGCSIRDDKTVKIHAGLATQQTTATAIGRALMTRLGLLLLDEFSLGP